MKVYRNPKNKLDRILCEDRPNTIFCMMSMDVNGTIFHHKADGTCTSVDWDLIDESEQISTEQ